MQWTHNPSYFSLTRSHDFPIWYIDKFVYSYFSTTKLQKTLYRKITRFDGTSVSRFKRILALASMFRNKNISTAISGVAWKFMITFPIKQGLTHGNHFTLQYLSCRFLALIFYDHLRWKSISNPSVYKIRTKHEYQPLSNCPLISESWYSCRWRPFRSHHESILKRNSVIRSLKIKRTHQTSSGEVQYLYICVHDGHFYGQRSLQADSHKFLSTYTGIFRLRLPDLCSSRICCILGQWVWGQLSW